jgi:Spy/CpxP family protein refolding chaperone
MDQRRMFGIRPNLNEWEGELMNARLCVVTAALAVLAVTAWSQPQPPPEGGPGMEQPRPMSGPPRFNPMDDNFFPPELVMRSQKSIGLTADQQTAIRSEMQKAMPHFTDLQWQQSAEEETLQGLLKQDRPDEKQVIAQLDKLLTIENDMKRSQMTMLIRIKNVLTPEQQEKLRGMKKQMEFRRQGEMGPRPGFGQPNEQRQFDRNQRGGGQRPPNPPQRDEGQ